MARALCIHTRVELARYNAVAALPHVSDEELLRAAGYVEEMTPEARLLAVTALREDMVEKARASIPDDPNDEPCRYASGHPGTCKFDDKPPTSDEWSCGECNFYNNKRVIECACCCTLRSSL